MKVFTLQIKIVLFILAILIILQGALLYQNHHNHRNSKALLLHSYQVINSIRALNNTIKNTEMNLYYASTQRANATIKTVPGLEDIQNRISAIRRLISDDPTQTLHLNQLQQMIMQVMELFKTQKKLEQFPTMHAKIEAMILNMINIESTLLENRKLNDEIAEGRFIKLFMVGCLLTYGTIIVLVWVLLRTFHQLRTSEARLERAVEGTSDGLWDWDPTTNEVYFSPRVKEMLGFSPGEWNESIDSFNDLIHPDDFDKVWSAARSHLYDKQTFYVEFKVRRKNGAYIWFASKGHALWDDQGKPIRMSGFFSDITQSKANEKLKNDFLSTLSYQLRTPLTSVKGSLGLLLSGVSGDLSEKSKNLIEIANKNCEKLINIINDILDMDKIESGKIEFDMHWYPIADLIYEAVQLNASYAEIYNIELNIVEPLLDNKVFVDKNRLLQVLSNLIANAARFSPILGGVDIGTTDMDDKVRVYVTDHGHGIPEANRKHIFDRFVYSILNDPKNQVETGFGLNISKAIIENFNGTIAFETEIDKGTTFYFDLPKETSIVAANQSDAKQR